MLDRVASVVHHLAGRGERRTERIVLSDEVTVVASTRIESSVTAISWIPSEAIAGLSKVPFEMGVTHYDEPPPDQLDDLEELRRTDRFREANELRAFIEVEDGRIVGHGHLGPGPHRRHDGPRRAGRPSASRPCTCPTSGPSRRSAPTSVRFVQTVGGRMGLPTPRPVRHKPFVQFWPSIAWTTLALTLNVDGSSSHELVGASPFPRHWIYDDDGRARREVGRGRLHHLVQRLVRRPDAVGRVPTPRPWSPASSPPSSGSSRRRIMRGGAKPKIRTLADGRRRSWSRATAGTDVFLILDGIFVVEVDGEQVAEIGPGAVVGERAALEGGIRTATLRATTVGEWRKSRPTAWTPAPSKASQRRIAGTRTPSRLDRADPLPNGEREPDTLPVEVIAMTMREALDKAMGHDSADGAMAALQAGGIAMANEDTMSQAIHDVYCGIMADHQHPNDKDRDQARQLIAALERRAVDLGDRPQPL